MSNIDSMPGQLRFFGSESADLFTRQVAASYQGVLTRNMVTDPSDPMVGFVSASARLWHTSRRGWCANRC